MARIKAVLRSSSARRSPLVLRHGDIEINLDAITLQVRGRRVETTTTEFLLLQLLMQSPGRVIPRERLLESVWGRDRNVDPRSVDVYMSRLRDKIEGESGTPRYLKTVRGIGYYFRALTPNGGNPVEQDATRAGMAQRTR